MSKALDAEELAEKRAEGLLWTDDMLRAYATAIREVAQPIADERDELREALKAVILESARPGPGRRCEQRRSGYADCYVEEVEPRDRLIQELEQARKQDHERIRVLEIDLELQTIATRQQKELRLSCESALDERDQRIRSLQAFKDYVHQRLDEAGIPTHPPGEHMDAGCRVGQRLDIALRAPTNTEA